MPKLVEMVVGSIGKSCGQVAWFYTLSTTQAGSRVVASSLYTFKPQVVRLSAAVSNRLFCQLKLGWRLDLYTLSTTPTRTTSFINIL